jgi:hypothetical protein
MKHYKNQARFRQLKPIPPKPNAVLPAVNSADVLAAPTIFGHP